MLVLVKVKLPIKDFTGYCHGGVVQWNKNELKSVSVLYHW